MAQPVKRGSFYWLRKKVPKDLRPIINKPEEKFSLRTRDPAEARIRFAKAVAEIEERWSRLRQTNRSLSHKETVAMAGEIYRRMVAEQEENPTQRAFYEMLLDQYAFGRATVTYLGSDKEGGKQVIKRMMDRRKQCITEYIDRFLIKEGHQIDAASRSSLQKHSENAILKARECTFKMSQGDYSPDPAANSFPAYEPTRAAATEVAPAGIKLSTAIEEWVIEKTRKGGGKNKASKKSQWTASSAKSYQLWAKRFEELVGDKPLGEYTKSDIRAFKQAVMRLPPRYGGKKGFEGLSFKDAVAKAGSMDIARMSDTNVNKILGFVSAFWSWAEGEYDEVKINPANKLNLLPRSSARDDRLPFSAADLQAIFDAPLYRGCKSGKYWHTRGEHIPIHLGIYWLPLIGLFTGARAGEIIQLSVDDIKQDDGIMYFNITDEGVDQAVKTDTSVRMIPVHPTLKLLGFEKFVSTQRRKGGRLFPEFPKAADGYYSTSYSPRFRLFLEKIGIKTDKNSFHSFRHSFEDACVNSKIPLEFINALQGHSSGGMAARYGSGIVRLRLLNEEMAKLHHHGLDLSKLLTASDVRHPTEV